jgi:hypothetical protein
MAASKLPLKGLHAALHHQNMALVPRFVRSEINRSEEASLLVSKQVYSSRQDDERPNSKSIIEIPTPWVRIMCNHPKHTALKILHTNPNRSFAGGHEIGDHAVEAIEAKEVVGEPINASRGLQALRILDSLFA